MTATAPLITGVDFVSIPAKDLQESRDFYSDVPVSDVDRAKAFYTEKVGFNADHDHAVSDEIRFVQLTPPGSACSISIGTGLTEMAPGALEGLQLVVDDIEQAHAELESRGVDVSDVQSFPWGEFVFFADPDGNRWAVQQIPDYS